MGVEIKSWSRKTAGQPFSYSTLNFQWDFSMRMLWPPRRRHLISLSSSSAGALARAGGGPPGRPPSGASWPVQGHANAPEAVEGQRRRPPSLLVAALTHTHTRADACWCATSRGIRFWERGRTIILACRSRPHPPGLPPGLHVQVHVEARMRTL